jgi:hypothetical protein
MDAVRGPRDIGTTDAGLRPATKPEIEAAGLAAFVVGEHDERTYFWPRPGPLRPERIEEKA